MVDLVVVKFIGSKNQSIRGKSWAPLLTSQGRLLSIPDFSRNRVARSLGFCVVFYRPFFVPLGLCLLAIALSVLLFTASDCPFASNCSVPQVYHKSRVWLSSDTLVLTTNKLDNNKIHHSTFSNSLKYFVSFVNNCHFRKGISECHICSQLRANHQGICNNRVSKSQQWTLAVHPGTNGPYCDKIYKIWWQIMQYW
jgi:hypothetical protein